LADKSPGKLYSVEFPQASSTCKLQFWYVIRGGQCDLVSSLVIKNKKEGVMFNLNGNANISTWQFVNVDIGNKIKIFYF
jgi:hypothetical protein